MMKTRNLLFTLLWFTLALLLGCTKQSSEGSKEQVNVYTHRHYDTDKALFRVFQEKTGIHVNVITANADELIQKLEMEGKDSPADILITVDAGRLYRAKQKGLLQRISSKVVEHHIPEKFRDKDNHWFAITTRARIIAYDKEKVQPDQLSTYQALIDEAWKGKILVRSSENIYNQSLLSSFIVNYGEESATNWASGVLANMARRPKGNDRDQMKAIAAGQGELAIVNTYYLGKLLKSDKPEEKAVGEKIAIFFPDQEGKGTHINVSGIAVTANAPNKENAIRLIEFLTDREAQTKMSFANYEYPVHPNAKWSPLLESWGSFKADTIDFGLLGEYNTKAVKIFDNVGWE